MFFWQPPPPPPPPPPTAAPTIIITTALVVACTVLLLYAVRAKRGKILAPGAPPGPLAPVGVLKNGFATRKIPADLDAVVVGSGIAGLTTAALLAKRGQRVLVLEQHDVAGGCTHTFEEKGFEFDTGVHYCGSMVAHSAILRRLSGGKVPWCATDGGGASDLAVRIEEQGGKKGRQSTVVRGLETLPRGEATVLLKKLKTAVSVAGRVLPGGELELQGAHAELVRLELERARCRDRSREPNSTYSQAENSKPWL